MIDNWFLEVFIFSFGSLFGANSRHFIFKKLSRFNVKKENRILIINLSAAFLIGLLSQRKEELLFYFLIGFIGSFSTFSTFIYDLFQFSMKRKFKRLTCLFFFNIFFGLFLTYLGYLIANQV